MGGRQTVRQADRQTGGQGERREWPQTWTHSFKKQERDLEFRIISALTGLERERGNIKEFIWKLSLTGRRGEEF